VATAAGQDRVGYLAGLDGLRAVAVSSVVVGHVIPETPPGSFLGVTVFFVISGFLITRQLLAEVDATDTVGLGQFWFRRVRRLAPGALITVVAVLAVARWRPAPSGLGGDSRAAVLHVLNWRYIASGSEYGNPFEPASPLRHFWSLSIEEQFYLAFPLVVLACVAASRGRGVRLPLGIVSALGLLVSIALQLRFDSLSRGYFGTDTRMGEMCIGVLAAIVLDRWTSLTHRSAQWMGLLGVALVGVPIATVGLGSEWLFRGTFAVVGIGTALLIASCTRVTVVGSLAALAPLRHIGKWSYGIYLAHWPLVVWIPVGLWGWPSAARFVLIVGTSIVLGAGLFALVERPIRRTVRRPAPAATSAWLGVTGAIVGISLLATGGGASTASTGGLVVPDGSTVPDMAAVSSTPDTQAPQPRASRVAGPPRMTLYGDSVVLSVIWNLGDAAKDAGVELNAWSRLGCDLNDGATSFRYYRAEAAPLDTGCSDWRTTIGPAIATQDPDVIGLMFGSAVAQVEAKVDGEWIAPCSSEFRRWYSKGQRSRIQFIRERTNAGMVVVLQAPAQRTGVGRLQPDDLTERSECIRRWWRNIAAAEQLDIIDLADFTCPDGPDACDQESRADGIHYGNEVAPSIATWMIDRLEPHIPEERT
jgi:peptidoglycan/LPS O-acetylase OafA/YrhL